MSFFTVINGFLQQNFATAEKEKSGWSWSTRERNMIRIFPISRYRLLLHERIFTLFWFMASQNTRWCLLSIKKFVPKRMSWVLQTPIFTLAYGNLRKFWLDYEYETLLPDITIYQILEYYKNGIDKVLETVLSMK